MSSALVTSLGRPEHPCGCPVLALSRKAPEPGQGAPPCTFRRTHKKGMTRTARREVRAGRRPPRPIRGRDADLDRLTRPEQSRHSAQGYCLGRKHPNRYAAARGLIGAGRPGQDSPDGQPRSTTARWTYAASTRSGTRHTPSEHRCGTIPGPGVGRDGAAAVFGRGWGASGDSEAGRTRRPAPPIGRLYAVPLSRGPGRGLHHPGGWPRRCPAQRPGSRTARSSAWRTSRPWPLRSAPP
jgi:hypothetical protein